MFNYIFNISQFKDLHVTRSHRVWQTWTMSFAAYFDGKCWFEINGTSKAALEPIVYEQFVRVTHRYRVRSYFCSWVWSYTYTQRCHYSHRSVKYDTIQKWFINDDTLGGLINSDYVEDPHEGDTNWTYHYYKNYWTVHCASWHICLPRNIRTSTEVEDSISKSLIPSHGFQICPLIHVVEVLQLMLMVDAVVCCRYDTNRLQCR